ncbi:Protein argonaute 4A [Zostera marina]|uniref:Protein argonaute 4A n=1 Tax=Zostera marina TaxID=29655 RepID=A0A0K9NLT3_ZOSMR|nr:Protein argonaute 4A [Zostera marina]
MDNSPTEFLPPPPPLIPTNVVPEMAIVKSKRVPIPRIGMGEKGQNIKLLTNHFHVTVGKVDGFFYHYNVVLKYDDDSEVTGKGMGRKVIEKLHQTYETELEGRDFAYDGENSLFTVGPLPQNKNEFKVVLDDLSTMKAPLKENFRGSPECDGSPSGNDRKRIRKIMNSKTFKVEINFAAKVPMNSILSALKGYDSENSQEAFRVLDIILRQNAAKQGCLLVRQSFFRGDRGNFVDLGGGVLGCRGLHSSFRTSQGGLSLNIDVSTTMIVKPGPVIDFLLENQNVKTPRQIDWTKAKRMLKNLRVKARPANSEYKITGLSELPCNRQTFIYRERGVHGEGYSRELTVLQYFSEIKGINIRDSAEFPCVNVGKPKRPVYFPIELCELISLQRYTKALSSIQRSSLVEKSRQKPQERMRVLTDGLRNNNYASDPLLKSCGISISNQFTQVDGRVLSPPKLKIGNGDDFIPRNGRWNFNNKKLYKTSAIQRWAVVNFSARCDERRLVQDLIKCGNLKGMHIEQPSGVFMEDKSMWRAPPKDRVEAMFKLMESKLPGKPNFLLCILAERKNSDIYGPWKRKNLADCGIITQCIAPTKINDQYLTNVLLKINAKLGGMNSVLTVEHVQSIPKISQVPTIILGMDVSHGPAGQSYLPSIAAVVSSREWPLISKYRAAVRTQSSKMEMIDSLFKLVENNGKQEDKGLMRELLLDFYKSSQNRKPENIIIFRDGVSESQFNQVLNIELDQIIEACKFLDDAWNPKFTVIVAQKNHHTKFFKQGSPDNVPPGTVIDDGVCHPKNFDFYICPHAGMIGTTRPTHYHVLYDEIRFSADEIQELVHSLSYVYQRSTTAISIVAPISYAHHAAAQVSQFMKFEEASESASSHDGVTTSGTSSVPELPRLHDKVSSSMFFC